MWTPATRRQHSRAGLRYASDLTDDEWRILEPLLPGAPGRGRRRACPLREIANAIFYVLRAGCTWRLLPDSFPPDQVRDPVQYARMCSLEYLFAQVGAREG